MSKTKIEFKYIHKLTSKELTSLYDIVSSDLMINLGNGKKWSKSKLLELKRYSEEDYKNNYKNTNYLFITLLKNKEVIGLGYIHPYNFSNTFKSSKQLLQTAIIIKSEEQKKGYGTQLLKKLIYLNKKYFKNPLLCLVNQTNIKSLNLVKHQKKIGELTLNNNKYNIYNCIN